MEMAEATDNCGEVSVTVDETIINGACEGQYYILKFSLLP